MNPWLEHEGLEAGHLEFNELDFETKQEKVSRVMQLWTSNMRTLNDCLDELGYEQINEEGDVYYLEWQNKQMQAGQPDMSSMFGGGGMQDLGLQTEPMQPQVPEPGTSVNEEPNMTEMPESYSLYSENFEPSFFNAETTEEDNEMVDDPAGLNDLENQTAINIRKHYKDKLDEVKKIASKKSLETLKEDLKLTDIRELTTLMKLGGEGIQKDFNKSIKQAFEKGIKDGGKQIGIISGVPYKAENYHALQKNGWRYVKKNIGIGTAKIEEILYKGLMGELKGKALEEAVGSTYSFIGWKSEQLARNELRKAYSAGIEYTMQHSPYKKYKWETSLDERTCPECAPKHGKIYSINNFSSPRAPLHINCRCRMKVVKE